MSRFVSPPFPRGDQRGVLRDLAGHGMTRTFFCEKHSAYSWSDKRTLSGLVRVPPGPPPLMVIRECGVGPAPHVLTKRISSSFISYGKGSGRLANKKPHQVMWS